MTVKISSDLECGIRDTASPDAETFKSYLAAQYSADTPVCIWYVMAEESSGTFTVPTLTPSAGRNTLSVGTALQPSYASITCMVGGSPVTTETETPAT